MSMERPEHRESDGNGAALVLVDSSKSKYWNYRIVDQTILNALMHFGIPFRMLDLSRDKLSRDIIAECACVVLGQSGLGRSIGADGEKLLADAVENLGIGLVCFDDRLECYDGLIYRAFGIEKVREYPFATDVLRIKDNEHFITSMQGYGELYRLRRMIPSAIVDEYSGGVKVLVEGILGKDQLIYIRHLVPGNAYEPKNYPVVLANRFGKGKTVMFTINPRIWLNMVYGHSGGLDEVFWKSIVWVARKPFVVNVIPKFVAFSIDDCRGAHDFKYVDICNKYGIVPKPSLFLREVPERLFPKIREGLIERKAEYGSHALSYYELLVFDFGRGELDEERLRKNFEFEDEFWKRVGVKQSKVNRFHWGENGVDALPYLKERNRLYFCPALQMGLRKVEQTLEEGYFPYGLQNKYYDVLPEDEDFFAFASFPPRGSEDFLVGFTPNLAESKDVRVDEIVAETSRRIRTSFQAGFFAELTTHEQKLECIRLDEWEKIIAGISEFARSVGGEFIGFDELGEYLKGRYFSSIQTVNVEDGKVKLKLINRSNVPLKVSYFREDGEDIGWEYIAIRPSDGEVII